MDPAAWHLYASGYIPAPREPASQQKWTVSVDDAFVILTTKERVLTFPKSNLNPLLLISLLGLDIEIYQESVRAAEGRTRPVLVHSVHKPAVCRNVA